MGIIFVSAYVTLTMSQVEIILHWDIENQLNIRTKYELRKNDCEILLNAG